jgi:carboxyl-terminal processing protease
MITGVFRESPAMAAGLDNGDIFCEVDGTNVTDSTTDEVAALVRGEAGTSVHLKMLRKGEFLEVDVERRELDVPTVEWSMLEKEGQIGYMQITQFTQTTEPQFEKGLQELRDAGMEKMILDLRGNPGGTVTAVVGVARKILPKGLVFYVEAKSPAAGKEEYTCPGADFDIPLVVLVNGYSASASEILSGAIQDAGVGTVMGTQTFGKGVVQTVFELEDGSGVKLTIGKYFTRGGQDINEKGITPDVLSEYDPDLYEKEGTDSQLRDAVDYLNGKAAGKELNAAMAS